MPFAAKVRGAGCGTPDPRMPGRCRRLACLPVLQKPEALQVIDAHLLEVMVAGVGTGLELGPPLARIEGRRGLDATSFATHVPPMLHLMIPVSFYWTCAT